MSNQSKAANGQKSTAKKARFDSSKIYLKDASFEAPSAPAVFMKPLPAPQSHADISIDNELIDAENGIYEVTLAITVTAKSQEQTLYLAEVKEAGIFQIIHPHRQAIDKTVNVACPTILLPFVREELNSLITKGGFNVFMMSPINFDMLYEQKLAHEAEKASADPHIIN